MAATSPTAATAVLAGTGVGVVGPDSAATSASMQRATVARAVAAAAAAAAAVGGDAERVQRPPLQRASEDKSEGSAGLSDDTAEAQPRAPPPRALPSGGPKRCVQCRTTNTPMWRGGPLGPKTLCNACGIRHKLNKPRRPADGSHSNAAPRAERRARGPGERPAENPYAKPVHTGRAHSYRSSRGSDSSSGGGSGAARFGSDGNYASGRASRAHPPLLTVEDCTRLYDPSRAIGVLGFDRWLEQERSGRSAGRFALQDLQQVKRACKDGLADAAAEAAKKRPRIDLR